MYSEKLNVNRPVLYPPERRISWLNALLIPVIDEHKTARHVVQLQIACVAPRDVADSNADIRLNRDIVTRLFVRMTEKDVVIPHTAHCQTQFVVKVTPTWINSFAGWEYVRSCRRSRKDLLQLAAEQRLLTQ